MISEHERVVLKSRVPAEGLEVGDVGTVVHVYGDGRAYEVEFVDRKSTRLNSSHIQKSRMPSSA